MIYRRYVTLIEMIIVMVLIGLILGIVAYNYTGAIDEGKAFKTKTGIEKLETILSIVISEDPDSEDNISSTWKEKIKSSPLVQNPNSLIKDGWGEEYQVRFEDGQIKVSSKRYDAYLEKNPESMFKSEEKD